MSLATSLKLWMSTISLKKKIKTNQSNSNHTLKHYVKASIRFLISTTWIECKYFVKYLKNIFQYSHVYDGYIFQEHMVTLINLIQSQGCFTLHTHYSQISEKKILENTLWSRVKIDRHWMMYNHTYFWWSTYFIRDERETEREETKKKNPGTNDFPTPTSSPLTQKKKRNYTRSDQKNKRRNGDDI